MTARLLEANQIATVVIGSAKDILQHCGTPRTVYNDLPLGNPIGKPYDRAMQRETMEMALNALNHSKPSGLILETPFAWGPDDSWKKNFMRLDNKDPAELITLGDENRRLRAENRKNGLVR